MRETINLEGKSNETTTGCKSLWCLALARAHQRGPVCACVCVCVETEVKLVFCSTEETNVDFREESNSRSINGWTISVVRTALRFSCGKTRKGKKKKRNRDIRLIIRDRDLRPTSRSKSRYCFNPSLSLSFFFHPFFVSLVSLRFFEIVRNSSFRNSREKVGGGSESVRYTIMWWKNGESWPKKVCDKRVNFLRDASL